MSKELIEKLSDRVRPNCEAAPWVVEEIKRMEAALEAKAAQPQSAEAVAWAAQNVSSGKYGYIWHEESDVRGWINLQHQSDNSTWRGPIALYTTPQPSAGVVIPERVDPESINKILTALQLNGWVNTWHAAQIWNACLDEFARLNGKETAL